MYLQDEERIERTERIQLAEGGRCGSNNNAWHGEGGHEGEGEKKKNKNTGAAEARGRRPAAATLSPCEDKSAESEAAAKVSQSAGALARRG